MTPNGLKPNHEPYLDAIKPFWIPRGDEDLKEVGFFGVRTKP